MPTRDRLTRSTTDKMIFGVAGGMATYFGVDPTIVRVLWVICALLGGFGVVLYIALGLVIPRDDEVDARPSVDPLRIAEERFARGEISAEELRSIKDTLRGGA